MRDIDEEDLSPPPSFDEDISEEELRKAIEEEKQKIQEMEKEAGREPAVGQQPSPGMQEDIQEGWNQLLRPQFEGTELEGHEDNFAAYILEVVPISNIKREWIPRYLSYFDENWQWIKVKGVKLPPYLWASFRMIFELNLTRAIGGLQRDLQQQSQMDERMISYSLEKGWNRFLQPDFENTELKGYSRYFKSALSNVVPLANIHEKDIKTRYLPYFDEVWNWLKVEGLETNPQAWTNFRFIFEINLTRSIGAFEAKKQAGFAEKAREGKEEGKEGAWRQLLDLIGVG